MVKKFLKRKQCEFTELNIDDNPSLRDDLMQLSGRSMVPVVVVEDENGGRRITTGFNPGELASLLE